MTPIEMAAAQARAIGIASRKHFVRESARSYDRAEHLPHLLPDVPADLLDVHDDIGLDFTRHVLLKLARLLKYHRCAPTGRRTAATNIAIAMTGEAAILRRQMAHKATLVVAALVADADLIPVDGDLDYLLVPVTPPLLAWLAEFGSEAADMEPDHDNEDDDPLEDDDPAEDNHDRENDLADNEFTQQSAEGCRAQIASNQTVEYLACGKAWV